MQTVTISKKEYAELKKRADIGNDFMLTLVRGLEDIKAGRVKPWKKKGI